MSSDATSGVAFQPHLRTEACECRSGVGALLISEPRPRNLKDALDALGTLCAPSVIVRLAVMLDPSEPFKVALEPQEHRGGRTNVAVLTCRYAYAVPVRAFPASARARQSEAAFGVEESRRPGALEISCATFADGGQFRWVTPRGTSTVYAAHVVLLDQIHCPRRLRTLDVSKVWPHQVEHQMRFFARGVAKHVDAIVARSANVAHPEHHALESKQHRRHAVAPGLRHRHVQLAIARPKRECARDCAAFAIEEACGPREVSSIKFRSKSIQLISSPARPTHSIEQMGDTVNGR